MHELSPGVVFENQGVKVIAAPTDHSPVHPTLGFRIEAEGKSHFDGEVVLAVDLLKIEA